MQLERRSENPLKLKLEAVAEELRQRLAEFRTFAVQVLKRRDPLLEFVALPSGGFHLSCKSNGHSRVFVGGCRFAAIIPGDSAAELVITNGLNNFLNLYNLCLIGRLLLTWFPSRPEVLEGPLSTLCDPYLNLFRGLIPPVANIDLSPILAFLVLNVFTSTAAALPAEVDESSVAQEGTPTMYRQYKPWELHKWASDMKKQKAKMALKKQKANEETA